MAEAVEADDGAAGADVAPPAARRTGFDDEPRAVRRQDVIAVFRGLPIERLTERDLQLAEEFLRRRSGLANRSALAGRILQSLLERMEARPEQAQGSQPEILIAEIVKAGRGRTPPS